MGKTVRARAPRRRLKDAGAARREGQPDAVAGGEGGGDRDPRPTRPAAEGAGVQNQRRPGARPARLAGLTPAASRAAAPRVQGPSLAQSEVTADTGNGEPASCLHPTGVPFHWSPPNGTPCWSPYIQSSGHPTYNPSLITPHGVSLSTFHMHPPSPPREPPLLVTPHGLPNLSLLTPHFLCAGLTDPYCHPHTTFVSPCLAASH